MLKLKSIKIIFIGLFVLATLFSCSMASLTTSAYVEENNNTDNNNIVKNDDALVTISLAGKRSWSISQYVLTASCDGYQDKTVVGSNSTISISLGEGEWTLNVESKDSDGNVVYKGTGIINISAEDSDLTVTIGLIKNAGNLKVNLSNIPASADSAELTLSKDGFDDITLTISDISNPIAIAQMLVSGDWALNVKCYDGASQVYSNDFTATVVTGVVTTKDISL